MLGLTKNGEPAENVRFVENGGNITVKAGSDTVFEVSIIERGIELGYIYSDSSYSLESVEWMNIPEIQFTPALPWGLLAGGIITLKTYTSYQDLIDGLLVIVLEAEGEEKDGIITYDENDGKYYLGEADYLKCYEVVNDDNCHVSFTPIVQNTKILSMEREFPEILSASPDLPWDGDITGTLNLTAEVEQQFILDKLKVITRNTSTGTETKRNLVLNNGRIECRIGNYWICHMESFVGRKSEFNIKTQVQSASPQRVKDFIIE